MGKSDRKKGNKKMIAVYLIVLAVLYVIIYVLPQVSDIFVETYIAEYGLLEIKDDVSGLLVRNEQVYKAASGGTVERSVKQGRPMRQGSRIVTVGAEPYYSKAKGIVSYYYDGYEAVFTPENMEAVTEDKLKGVLEEGKVSSAKKGTAAAGDVVFKIVDNQQWYVLCWLDNDKKDKYTEGTDVTLEPKKGEERDESAQIKMTVKSVIPQGDKALIILSCNRYYEDFDRYRVMNCYLITFSQRGILLETDSIVEEEGQTGVYVVDKLGNYAFKPIKVIKQDGDVSVAEINFFTQDGNQVETIKNYTEILRPKKDS